MQQLQRVQQLQLVRRQLGELWNTEFGLQFLR